MKICVGVMFGGESVEHEISILSAMQVIHALDEEKYEVIPIYIAKDHTMYQDDSLWEIETYQDMDKLIKNGRIVNLIKEDHTIVVQPLKQSWFTKKKHLDIVLPIIHGTNGEDGTIQGYLEMLRVPYCGCDVLGAAIGQDKVIMKQVLDFHHIATPTWFYTTIYEEDQGIIEDKCQTLGYPLIIKPANLGSSVGISIIHDQKELHPALKEAFLYDEKVVIEKVVENLRELNISIMGNRKSKEISSIEEVIRQDHILSYKDKYEGSDSSKGMASTNRILPAQISDEMKKQIEAYAIATFDELCAEGIVRIDFLIDDQEKIVYVNEINTIPGSLAFYLWKDKGYSFTSLLDQLITIGIDKVKRKERRVTSYDTNVLNMKKGLGSKGVK